MDPDRQILEHLEPALRAADRDDAAAMLAFVVYERVAFDPQTVGASVRRALLVQAAGGDLRREVTLDDVSVGGLASDLDAPERREELVSGLTELRNHAEGLPGASAALDAALADPDRSWRALAAAILAAELTEDDE